MKVKVSIINTWCVAMSEAVTMPNVMMTSMVSEESLARDTHRQIDFGLVYLKTFSK